MVWNVVAVFVCVAVLVSGRSVEELDSYEVTNIKTSEAESVNATSSECLVERKTFVVNTTEKVSWYRAYINCHRNKMDLVVINNKEEYDLLVNAIKEKLPSTEDVGVWTSGYYDRELSKYRWITRLTPMTYSVWRPGRPELTPSEARCVELRQTNGNTMDDVDCITDNYGACQSLTKGGEWGKC